MQCSFRETKPSVYYFERDTLKVIFHWCCEYTAIFMQHTCVIKWQTLVIRKLASIQIVREWKNFLKSNRKVCYELSLNLNDYRVYLLPSGQMCSTHQNFFVTYPFVNHKTSMKCLWHNTSFSVQIHSYHMLWFCLLLFSFAFFVPEGKIQIRWKSNREPVTNTVKLM